MYTTVICNFSLFALQGPPPAAMMMTETQGVPPVTQGEMSSAEFYSTEYPSVYRETVVHKDERGHYIDPFRGLASKGYGRRLMYDQSHPQVRLSDGQEFEQVIGTRGPRQDSQVRVNIKGLVRLGRALADLVLKLKTCSICLC